LVINLKQWNAIFKQVRFNEYEINYNEVERNFYSTGLIMISLSNAKISFYYLFWLIMKC